MTLPTITVADLLANTIEEGDCMLWTGRAEQGKFPRFGRLPVRRALWTLVNDGVPHGLQVGCKCGTPLCVNPDHLIARTKSKALRGIPKKPDVIARITLTKRATHGKLSMEIARAIRASDKSCRELDREYGLCAGKAWKIRNNLTWKDGSNPFTGLGAR